MYKRYECLRYIRCIADISEVKKGRFNLGTIRRAVDELENDGVLKYAGKCNWTLNK